MAGVPGHRVINYTRLPLLECITAEQLRSWLDYDRESGAFTWKVAPSKAVHIGDRAGSVSPRGYWKTKVAGKYYSLHRLAWLHVYGEWPKGVIDHVDGDKGNNRVTNLRDVTTSVNGQNQRAAMSHNTCGFLGVTFEKQTRKFKAAINIDGLGSKTLGRFPTAEEAHKAYLTAKRQHHVGCAV